MKGVASWPEGTTESDVLNWWQGERIRCLDLFSAAIRRRDEKLLKLFCQQTRQIATRLDAYRRMKVRQWREEEKQEYAGKRTD